MASFLLRNDSQFHYLHYFAYLSIKQMFRSKVLDVEPRADEDEGQVCYNSNVQHYLLLRPLECKSDCLCDYTENYLGQKKTSKVLPYLEGNLSRQFLGAYPRKRPAMLVVSHKERAIAIVNTSSGFEGMICVTMYLITKMSHMERY